MKKLTDFLNEKLVICHQPVDEKLVIFPSQVNEKLVINKNFKVIGNDEFYETFKESISDLMECQYFTYHRHFKDIRYIPIASKLSDEINDAFEKAKSSSGEMMYDKTYSGFTGFEFIVKVIETSEILCALIGPKKVTPTSAYGDIIVTYK